MTGITSPQPPAVATTNQPTRRRPFTHLGVRAARLRRAPALRSVPAVAAHTAPSALRLGLAAVFVWFGVLKLVGHSPVAQLLGATFPWADPHVVVVVLGAAEVALGLALVLRRYARFVLPVAGAHLCGTFVTFLVVPGRMFAHGNPLLLTADGEFVVKNLVIIAAILVLLTTRNRSQA